jgi:hypothetical protein
MAQKVIIDLEAKTDAAVKEIADLKKEIEKLNQEVASGNKDTKEGLKDVEKASDKTAGGIRKIGGALKAAGIGLAIAAFAKFTEILNQNQKVADFFNTTFETLSIAFNDFFNFIDSNAGVIIDYFKAIFEDPIGSLKDFGQAIFDNVIERIKSSIDALGFLASAVVKVFEGDFSGAMESAKSAGKELIDVVTGVDNTFEKTNEVVSEYVKTTIKAAKSNVELEKSARRAEAANQGLIEKYDRQAEQLRQIRDDESKSFEERIKANDDLGKLLDEQEKAMKENAQARVNQAAVELAKNKENIDLQVAYQEALNEQAAIEAQITGFRSEQQTNVNSLLREQKDLQNELALIGKTEREIERTELQQDYDAKKALIEREISDEATKKEMLANLESDYNSKIAEIDDEAFQEKLVKAEKERNLEKQKIRDKQMVVDAISQFADAESGIGKALLIAKQALALQETLLDVKRITFKGSQAIGEAGVNASQNVSESSKIGFPQNIITIAAAIAQGVSIIRSVKSAVSKTKAQASSMASSFTPSVDSPSSAPPAFNVVGTSGANQLAGAIASQQQQPVKAFVVSNDVTTAQELDRNIVSGATIG